jgi:hypothetical protein
MVQSVPNTLVKVGFSWFLPIIRLLHPFIYSSFTSGIDDSKSIQEDVDEKPITVEEILLARGGILRVPPIKPK